MAIIQPFLTAAIIIQYIILMADCNPERIMCFETHVNQIKYIPVLNVLLITYSLGLHKICSLKTTSSKGA